MAKVLLAGVRIPFVHGGQDVLMGSLERELKKRGHEVERLELPHSPLPKENLIKEIAIWKSLEVERFAGPKPDIVIATKFPSYFISYGKKSVWLVHQHREIYDLYGSHFSGFSDSPADEALRQSLIKADTETLGKASFLSGISGNVVGRLKQYNQLDGKVLYPPLPLGGQYKSGNYGDYILMVNRLCRIKRVELVIKAMAEVHPLIKLKIVGKPDEPGIEEYYKTEIEFHNLQDRVEFLGRVDDEALIELYANALGVAYVPLNEDYGYVTLEGMASSKPIITTTDSGGVLEFIEHGRNGLVSEPEPSKVAESINTLVKNREMAKELGAAGNSDLASRGVLESAWDEVIASLLSPIS